MSVSFALLHTWCEGGSDGVCPKFARTHPQDLGQRTARRPENHDASASDGEHLLFDARAVGHLFHL